jgi:hypothetical protein
MNIPREIDSALVILYSTDPKLAICQYGGEENFYLYGCDENWESKSDTWHANIEDAKRRAESDHEGVTLTWQSAE